MNRINTRKEILNLVAEDGRVEYVPTSWMSLRCYAEIEQGFIPVRKTRDGEIIGEIPNTPDWGVKFVSDGGISDNRWGMLVPRSHRAREAMFWGKVARLVAGFDFCLAEAIKFAKAQRGIRFAHEGAVIDLAAEIIYEYDPDYIRFVPDWGRGPHDRWVDENGLPQKEGLSAPRYQAAWKVVRAYYAGCR